ncbi:hypothetical protein MGU_09185 [Metarhizium guizhouense ARSEF 977]|uniref:Uncharacterized protein n=1 Tax=Metarhizium guizhouense (strain ARSEF 977) TaxID=1276136 RepID=A0A0B4G9V2_METGA|nr:hypothetical protein MGU_09185 [Metarhizium guizhouense ARSEF 977]
MKSIALALALGCLTSASAVTPGTKPRPSHTDNPGCPAPTTTPTTANPPHTTPGPSECGVTTTHTWYGNKTMGCQYDPLGGCIADAILTLPCGCTKATNVVQQTTTVCATVPSAVNCVTGFMFTTTSTNC